MYIEIGLIFLFIVVAYLVGKHHGQRDGYEQMNIDMEEMISTGQLHDHRADYDQYLAENKENWNI